jgi:hypothetical protein
MASVLTWAERPDLAERGPASEEVWPEYNRHGDVFDDWWSPLLEELPEFQFALYDDAADVVLAEAHTGPLAWDGDDAHLPGGIDDALERVVTARRSGGAVDTLCAFAAEVDPSARERGLAAGLLRGMSELAGRHRLRRLIAPVRPSWKERYPLTPLPRSMRITGSVSDWEEWTGLALPESGSYVFPHGLAPLAVDCAADNGTYWEPNVWMIHPELRHS